MDSRTTNVKKNIIWNLLGTGVNAFGGFIVRTVFIYVLGATYLGVESLFTNVLAVLSFSELGIASAISFALYKPIADNDEKKIIALMRFFRNAYRVIAAVVACLGLCLLPILDYLINADLPMSEIRVYYLISLFNTVTSYFVVYKSTYVTALQKDYLVNNFTTISQCVSYICRIIIILLLENFLFYLIVAAVVQLVSNVARSVYFDYRFPILKRRDKEKIDKETKKTLWGNVRALVCHQIGGVFVHSTDSIVISAVINTVSVGYVANYTLITSFALQITNKVLNSFTASFGNLIASSDSKTSERIFDEYDFIGYALNTCVFVCCLSLVQPFVKLWIGDDMLLGDVVVFLIFFTSYLEWQNQTVYVVKVAGGIFRQDTWLPITQAVINLAVSIPAAYCFGIAGVYIGTLAQRLVSIVVRPWLVYKYTFKTSATHYYARFVVRTVVAIALGITGMLVVDFATASLSWFTWGLAVIAVVCIFLAVFCLLYSRTEVFKKVLLRVKRSL